MAFSNWQVGLSFENGGVWALAVQRRRQGWQLRHWWHYRQSEHAETGDDTLPAAGLDPHLKALRRQLPRRISLRVCLPEKDIMHQRMAAPDRRLGEPEREWLVSAQARRHFSGGQEPLLFDYRHDPSSSNSLLVTAARRTMVAQWLSCLERAGFIPDVLEIAPCALRCMAGCARLSPDRLLIHAAKIGWHWVSALSRPLEFGFISSVEAPSLPEARALVARRHTSCSSLDEPVYLSGDASGADPSQALSWSPFSALWQASPPMPAQPAAFVIAGGLAIRPWDE